MVILTFIRHGETDFNKNGILQGHLNIPLNQNGRDESAIIGTRLSSQIEDHPVDLIISSDLDRASETASIILQHLLAVSDGPIPFIQTPILRERYLGKLEGVDLKQLVNWRELTEQPKQMIDIQKILSLKKVSLTSIFTNNNSNNINISTPSLVSHPQQQQQQQQQQIKIDELSLESSSSTSSLSSSPSSSTSSFTEFTSEESSTSSSLSSSTSSLSSIDEIETRFTNLNSTISSSNSPTSVINNSGNSHTNNVCGLRLTSNILKHLPQKELKLESKSKLIKRAKDAFQFILKQVPDKYIAKSTSSQQIIESTENNNPNNNTNNNNNNLNNSNFHIVIVSHNVMLRALVSLLFCKKSTSPSLFCNKFLNPSSSSNGSNSSSSSSGGGGSSSSGGSSGNNNSRQLTQSESSSRNFKWIQLEFKNNYLRTCFNVLEKKSTSTSLSGQIITLKRVPRNIEMVQYSESTNINNVIDLYSGGTSSPTNTSSTTTNNKSNTTSAAAANTSPTPVLDKASTNVSSFIKATIAVIPNDQEQE